MYIYVNSAWAETSFLSIHPEHPSNVSAFLSRRCHRYTGSLSERGRPAFPKRSKGYDGKASFYIGRNVKDAAWEAEGLKLGESRGIRSSGGARLKGASDFTTEFSEGARRGKVPLQALGLVLVI